jgi:hypothetical protein
MAFHDPPAGHDEACRIEPETTEGSRCLADQHALIAA